MIEAYIFLKLFEHPLVWFTAVPLGFAAAAFIAAAVYGISQGKRPTVEGLLNGAGKLQEMEQEKIDHYRWYKSHKPHPWSVWRD